MHFKILVILLVGLILSSCYTIITHPRISEGNYTRQVKFYDNCTNCHTINEMVNFGYYHLVVPRPNLPGMWFHIPSYYSPWWFDVNVSMTESPEPQRKNDETRLRDYDGNRSLAPTNVSTPSRSSGSSNSGSSQNSSVSSDNSSQQQDSRQQKSTNPKSRDNSGERKK